MKITLENQEYDTLLLPIEWRFSAALVGVQRYFNFVKETEGQVLCRDTDRETDGNLQVYSDIGGYIQGLKYNRAELTEERYLRFCEAFFWDDMQHVRAEKILKAGPEYSEEQIDKVNSLLTGQEANTVLKKVFEKRKFDGTNADEFLKTIEENRQEIIRETYRYKTNLYRNFANTNKLFSEQNAHCRLLGYDLDENRKSRSAAYRFDTDSFLTQDCIEFDFIPFAFTNSLPESYFINNNFRISDLMKCNETIKEQMEEDGMVQDNRIIRDRGKTKLIKAMIYAYDYFDFDVEVIVKKRDAEVFETFFVRKKALQELKRIYETQNLSFVHQYSFNYYLSVEEEVIRCCVNNLYLDSLLERLLVISRERENTGFIIHRLLEINVSWKGDGDMSALTMKAKGDGYNVRKMIIDKGGENKAKSYKNKLINAIVAHDYDRVLEIMLQMSGYINSEIGIIYDMLEHKEECSDIAISFTNSLLPFKSEKE